MATTPDTSPATADATGPSTRRSWTPVSAWAGLGVVLLLMLVTAAVPQLLDWNVWARSKPAHQVPPLHGKWEPKLFGPGTLPALAVALIGWRYALEWAERLSWRRLLLTSYVGGLAWLLSLAYVDGSSGISRVLGSPYEYLPTARATTSIHGLLQEYVARIPYSAAPDNWPTHVAGHPPGALLVFVGLDRVGLGSDYAAGLVVTVVAASTSLAVMVAVRALGAEATARRAAPFLVLTPAALYMAVSADALFAAVAAWGLAALAIAATCGRRPRTVAWATLAGLLLGYCVMMSYGLPLLALLAVAVLSIARSWLPLPVAVLAALAVVLAFAAAGFSWWEAYPVLHDRYWDGIAALRPASYWLWGDLAALAFCAGPLLGAGLGLLAAKRAQADRVVALLVTAAVTAILVADVSRMSKAETERIWLPFVPWMMLSITLLPERWRRWGLGLQLLTALLVQHLLYTSW